MLFTLTFLLDLFPAYDGKLNEEKAVDHVLTDSRMAKEGSLFVPLIGDRFDGHEFLNDAVQGGAVATLWQKEKPKPANVPDNFLFIYVEDTLEALQQLAKAYRHFVQPIVIGITGSNGKTTTKDLLHAVLQRNFKTHATAGNLNNEIGLPLTILQMERDTEMLILEMGMNHFHEIERLTKLAQPNYAIITNIGESHIEFLGSRAGIAEAKWEITIGLQRNGVLYIDGDESLLTEKQKDIATVSCGFNADNAIEISDIHIASSKTTFNLNHDTMFTIPLLGKHHAKNASYVIALARKLGMNDKQIQIGLKELAHSSMRFEQLHGKNNVLLINDAYNASVTSMIAAIDVVKDLKEFKTKVIVLGDILELGKQSKELHRSVTESIDENINFIYTYGHNAKEITDQLEEKPDQHTMHFKDKKQLEHILKQHLNSETVMLFKASRMMQFEQLVEACK